jgi:hypothetical protein
VRFRYRMTRRFMMAKVAVLAGITLLSRCGTDHKTSGGGPVHIAKINVNQDGVIVMNDKSHSGAGEIGQQSA